MPGYANLTRGLNLWSTAGGIVMQPGEATDAQDVLPRIDGAIFKHWGWRRLNDTALGTRIIAIKGFSYKGKNNDPVAIGPNPARGGNFGLADDGAIYTRRDDFYTAGIVLTETECWYWDPATELLAGPVALPAGVVVNPDPKPTITVHKNNAYIVGWATANLRFDPVDRVLYIWGWVNPPANAGHTGLQAGGTLVADATYRYRLSWVDMFTGEESGLSVEYAATTTAANRTVLLDGFVAYIGLRHFIDLVNLTNEDVGVVVYRTDPDEFKYFFLALVPPALAAATLNDNGLAVSYDLKADTRVLQEPPVMNTMTEFKGLWWGVSWVENWARVYFNDFRGENSYWERWDPRDYRELPLQEGETITAVEGIEKQLVALTSIGAHALFPSPNFQLGTIDITNNPLQWEVGCVGPRAKIQAGGYLYFLSDRGPYRWRPGMLKPEWLGKGILPMFLDPETDLCQMNAETKLDAEIGYDGDADALRFIFPCGASPFLNRHLIYPLQAEAMNGDPASGWIFASTHAQALEYTNVFGPLTGGFPVTPFDRPNYCVFSDELGYLYEYDPRLVRGGVPAGFPATGVVQAGSAVNLIVTLGVLPVVGDGLAGALVEVVYADGTTETRRVAANTATDITPDLNFSADPIGATWYVGGIPSYWRSWIDHMDDPTSHKTVLHLHVGFNREFATGDQVIAFNVYAGDEWATDIQQVRTGSLTKYRSKEMISWTARYFMWEFANSHPDEPFMISFFEPELKPVGKRY